MADGMNDVRAIRLTEIIQDFRVLQHRLSQIRAVSTPDEQNARGYILLQQCIAEGRAILQAQFNASAASPNGDPEREKQHLQYVMLDASTRRFQAQRIYLRATAAMRCINTRNALLNGQRPTAAHQAQLQQIDRVLQDELARITDQAVYAQLRSNDTSTGKWVNEDPSLSTIQAWIQRTGR